MIKKIIAILLLGTFLVAIYHRARVAKNKVPIEICLDWTQTQFLLDQARSQGVNIDLPQFLKRCHQIGVASFAVMPDRLEQWNSKGLILFFSSADLARRQALGLNLDCFASPEYLWIAQNLDANQHLSNRILTALSKIGGPLDLKSLVQKQAGYIIVKNPYGPWDKMLDLRLGQDPLLKTLLRQNGLQVVSVYENLENFLPLQKANLEDCKFWIWDFFPSSVKGAALRKLPWPLIENPGSTGSFILLENQIPFLATRIISENNQWAQLPIVRGHTVAEEDLKSLKSKALFSRWLRAARERSCHFFYYTWNLNMGLEENFSNLNILTQKLKQDGFVLRALPKSARKQTNIFLRINVAWRWLLAWLMVITIPVLGLLFLKRELAALHPQNAGYLVRWSLAHGVMILSCFAAAVLTHLLLPDAMFKSGITLFSGIRVALLLPLLLSVFILIPANELFALLNKKVSVLFLLLFLVAALALYVMMQRSGNFAMQASGGELFVRQWLEDIFKVRPRFKEIFFGHFWLILGGYFYIWSNADVTFNVRLRWVARLCLLAGMPGILSIFNTFCHLHSPLDVSMLRTAHGIWIGSLPAVVVCCVLHRLRCRGVL